MEQLVVQCLLRDAVPGEAGVSGLRMTTTWGAAAAELWLFSSRYVRAGDWLGLR